MTTTTTDYADATIYACIDTDPSSGQCWALGLTPEAALAAARRGIESLDDATRHDYEGIELVALPASPAAAISLDADGEAGQWQVEAGQVRLIAWEPEWAELQGAFVAVARGLAAE